MDSRKRKLVAGLLALFFTAVLIGLLVFALSSKAPQKDQRGRVNIAALEPGRLVTLDTGALRYFIVRPVEGDLYVLATPTVAGAVPMPDTYWWKPFMTCKDFGLDTNAGEVASTSRFCCRDSAQPKEWSQRWQWDVHGRHVPDANNTPIADMHRVNFVRSDDEIIFTRIESD